MSGDETVRAYPYGTRVVSKHEAWLLYKQLFHRRYAVHTPIEHFGTSGNRRRSQRILISASICVSGKNPAGAVFDERTSTLILNSHGALILLKEKVSIGQALTVQHSAPKEEIGCIVKGMNPESHGVPEIAIEFQKASPTFWHISFPSLDWNSRGPTRNVS